MSKIESLSQREVYPSNRANALNSWSWKDGAPTLVFQIGEQDRYLRSSSLRLNFKLRLQRPTGTSAVPVYPNNNGADGGAAFMCLQNSKVGALACFSSINVTNSRNNSLERVLNLPRLQSSYIATGSDFTSYANELQLECGATSSQEAQGRRENAEQEVCARVLCGMFLMGEDIPLGPAGRGTSGLIIKLNLAASIEALHGADAAGCFYEIVNPSLTFQVGNPAGGTLPAISALPYTSFSSYYNVISTGDDNMSLNCGLSSVISSFTNFCPVSYIASTIEDGVETYTLRNAPYTSDAQYAPITSLTFYKNGLQFPYAFDVNEAEMITNTAGVFAADGYTSQRELNFLSALQPSKDRTKTLAGNISESGLGSAEVPEANRDRYNTISEHVYGIGCRYDGLGHGSSTNFKEAQYSTRIRSGLNGSSPNACFTFLLHRNMINFTNGGISVSN